MSDGEPWNPTNPEWWKLNVEVRPSEHLYQWLANEYIATAVTAERLADVIKRLGFSIFFDARRYEIDMAARTIVWALEHGDDDERQTPPTPSASAADR